MTDVADLDRTKNTEMFDNDYVTPATACRLSHLAGVPDRRNLL